MLLGLFVMAVVTAIQLLGHLSPELSRRALAFRGLLFYRRDTLDEEAGGLHRRFVRSAGLFFAPLLVAIVGSAVAAGRCI